MPAHQIGTLLAPEQAGSCRQMDPSRPAEPDLGAEAHADFHPLPVIIVVVVFLHGRGFDRQPLPCLCPATLIQCIIGQHLLVGSLLLLILLLLCLLEHQWTCLLDSCVLQNKGLGSLDASQPL